VTQKKRCYDYGQRRQVEDWLKENAELIANQGAHVAARLCSADVGFSVSLHIVTSMAKFAGVTIRKRPAGRSSSSQPNFHRTAEVADILLKLVIAVYDDGPELDLNDLSMLRQLASKRSARSEDLYDLCSQRSIRGGEIRAEPTSFGPLVQVTLPDGQKEQ